MLYSALHGLISKIYPIYPIGAVFSVTSRCTARCIMCNIWRHQSKDAPIEKFLNLVKSPVFSKIGSVALTGGEPTLRNDLPMLVEHLIRRSPRLSGINITTNGMMPDRLVDIIRHIDEIRSRLRPGLHILVQISLDGPEPIHDRIRGVDGTYRKVLETVNKLEDLITHLPGIDFYFLCVLLPLNITILNELDQFFLGLKHRVVYNLLSDATYILPNGSSPRLDKNQEIDVARFLREQINNGADPLLSFHYGQVASWLETGFRTQPCGVTDQHIIIAEDGAVLPCLNYTEFRKTDIESPEELTEFWKSRTHRKIRHRIRKEVCPNCFSFCGPNTFDATLAVLQLKLARYYTRLFE